MTGKRNFRPVFAKGCGGQRTPPVYYPTSNPSSRHVIVPPVAK
jgi:hypothetical protein